MPANSQLRHAALEHLRGQWLYPVLSMLLFIAVSYMAASVPFGGLLVSAPLAFGFTAAYLQFVRGEAVDDELVTRPFAVFNHYGRWLGASLLVMLFVFLWSLLLVIPGIVKSYSYALTPYILHDNPELKVTESLRCSQQMMQGYKGKLFLLDLSFIGWILLGIITFGIGFLWVRPYMITARAKFYEELKSRQA
ncbi:MAG: DUF975 family protein [Bacteroidales bacterium]|nr:DUF975 family protein [Bacteroidales bacterium]